MSSSLCVKKQGEMPADNGESCLETVVTIQDVAALGVTSERTLQRLVKEGTLQLAKNKRGQFLRGRFILGQVIPRYCENLRDSLAEEPSKAEFHRERAAKMKLERQITEMDVAERRGELLRKNDLQFELEMMVSNIRDAMRSIPSRTMFRICHQKDPRVCNQILSEEIDAVLHRVADGEIWNVERLRKATRKFLRDE